MAQQFRLQNHPVSFNITAYTLGNLGMLRKSYKLTCDMIVDISYQASRYDRGFSTNRPRLASLSRIPQFNTLSSLLKKVTSKRIYCHDIFSQAPASLNQLGRD